MITDGTFLDQQTFFSYLGGVGRAILGKSSQKFNTNNNTYVPTAKTFLLDTGLIDLMRVAINVPHLNVVISKGAEMFANMEILHVDKKGNSIENSEVLKLLNNPNPIQNLESFLYDFYINNAVYSSNFCFKNKSAIKSLPSFIWWLPPGYVKVNLTGKMFRQTKIEDIIENYELLQYNEVFTPQEIIHICEGVGQMILKPTSKIESLKIPLSNIVAALKSNNIILTERGMIGFITRDQSGSGSYGTVKMLDVERDRIADQYKKDNDLDSDNSHVGVFVEPVKWTPMTFDVDQLKLYEGLEDSFGLICGAWGIDRDIFPSTKGATNENKEAGEKKTYNSSLLPLGKKLCNYLANDFGLTERGEKLICSYSHLPIMQADKLQEGKAKQTVIAGLSIALRDGVIDHQTYADEAELPMTGSGEISQQTQVKIDENK